MAEETVESKCGDKNGEYNGEKVEKQYPIGKVCFGKLATNSKVAIVQHGQSNRIVLAILFDRIVEQLSDNFVVCQTFRVMSLVVAFKCSVKDAAFIFFRKFKISLFDIFEWNAKRVDGHLGGLNQTFVELERF